MNLAVSSWYWKYYRIGPENMSWYTQKTATNYHHMAKWHYFLATIVPLCFFVLFLYSGSASGWSSHGNRIPIRGLHAVSGIQKKNSPHWWPWQHTSLWVHILPETVIGAATCSYVLYAPPWPALLMSTNPPPTMLFLGEGVQLPACSWESSPGPRRQSYPLHCGMWLWNPHSWWHCLDWASTGDTWPTNKQIILFTVQCMLDNHKYIHVIYWTIRISCAPCFWHFGDPFFPKATTLLLIVTDYLVVILYVDV